MKRGVKLTAKKTVLTSLFVDVVDILLNFLAAIITGSIVMIAETLQGISDFISAGFLYLGLRRSERPEDKTHPFGYGKVIYFWILLSSIVMLILVAALSIYFGIMRLISPQHLDRIIIAYTILVISIFTNGYALSVSSRRLLDGEKPRKIWNKFRNSEKLEARSTFVLDSVGVMAAILGLIALILFQTTGNLTFDGWGAIAIGILMILMSLTLLIGIKGFLIGKSASKKVEERIKKSVLEFKEVKKILGLKTMYLGLEKILVNLEVHIRSNLKTKRIEKLMDDIKEKIKKKFPEVKHIQIELETPDKK